MDNERSTKIVVTGASGQLGGETCRVFAEHHETVGLTRADLDVRDAPGVEAAIRQISPDVVVHCAAFTDVDGAEARPDEALAVNADGTAAVARAAESCGASMVYISTDYVFSGDQRTPYVESDPPEPLSVYGRSKWEGERRAAEECSRLWIVRTCGLYSARGSNFPLAILKRAQAGETLRVVNDQIVGAPTYARDLAQALSQLVGGAGILVRGTQECLPHAPFGIYHLTNQGICTWFEFARAVLEAAGLGDVSIQPITTAELARPAPRPPYSVLANRAWEALGFQPLRPYEEALRDFLQEVASDE